MQEDPPEMLDAATVISSRVPRSVSLLKDGELLDERYRIEGLVGKGGMCTVYKARALHLNRAIAIKVLNPTFSKEESALRRFQREAAAVAALEHPNIVRAFGCGMYGDLPYMAIEFLEGLSLADLLKEQGPIPVERFERIVRQVLEGLKHAHSQGIVHRDLKPSNIMILAADQARLVDFGIARILPESGKEIQKLTQTGEIFGTVAYMSPEQCTGSGADVRSDIYALGCIMYEMLTGQQAFTASTTYALLAKQMSELPEQHPALGSYEKLIFKCLAKNPAERPQTVAELLSQLKEPDAVGKVTTSIRVRGRKLSPVMLVSGTIALTIVVASGVLFGGKFFENRDRDQVSIHAQIADLQHRIRQYEINGGDDTILRCTLAELYSSVNDRRALNVLKPIFQRTGISNSRNQAGLTRTKIYQKHPDWRPPDDDR